MKEMFSMSAIGAKIDGFVFNREERMISALHYIGVDFVNNARVAAEFTDQTGNLRSSIGYAILLDGKVIDEDFEGEIEGIAASKTVVKELAHEYNTGLVLIGLAGMEYAAAVESKGYDVITGSTPIAEDLLNYLKKELQIGKT